ncbi:hypothetical protein AB0D04_22630 [Streptomyces sp. NPDC048483]|uniref:hypothetical protein n=1 Tax=Streptomyces sp. NPDC048483 TaxID=3154927 RepID=UPI0034259694
MPTTTTAAIRAPQSDDARLLPWAGVDGKPCYLLGGDGAGYVSRIADDIERLQLTMADDLLDHADYLLADHHAATTRELRFLARGLTDVLRDVRRITESRGARLPVRTSAQRDG